jgi:hypothetical protein
MSTRLLPLAMLAVAALSACAPSRSERPEHERPQVAVTPNGEPLPQIPGPDGCRSALATWFAAADKNGDGQLDAAELRADAERWFAKADYDGNGEITADELTVVRLGINPLPELEPDLGSRRGGGPGNGPRGGGPEDRSQIRSQSQVDPVMAADANADFRVTKAEFLAYVAAKNPGPLSMSQVQDSCRRQPAA